MKRAPHSPDTPYPVYHAHVAKITDIPDVVWPSEVFTLLLCADYSCCHVDELASLADYLMDSGNLYFCAWGAGCERAHDVYDEQYSLRDVQQGGQPLVMTTWHDSEPLQEALWFALFCATVDSDDWDECATVVVTVAHKEWQDEVARDLSDIVAFYKRVQ